MTLLALFAIMQSDLPSASPRGRAADPLVAFKNFAKAHPVLEVTIEAKVNDRPGPKGVLLLERGRRAIYRGTWGTFHSVVCSTDTGYLDLELSNRMYDDRPALGRGRIVRSRLSPIPEVGVPIVPYLTELEGLIPKTDKFTVTSGATEDTLSASTKTQGGTISLTLKIDKEGKPTYLRVVSEGMDGRSDRVWSLSNYRYPAKVTDKDFPTAIPLGYSPHALPDGGYPLQPNDTFPVAGWKDSKGKVVDLGGKRCLVAVLFGDDGLVTATTKMLDKLKSELPVHLLGELPGGLRDPDGSRLKKLNVSFSPTFFLIDAKGKVEAVFMGFDRDEPEKTEGEIRSALKPKAAKG